MTNIAHHAHQLARARATLETASASAAKVRAEADALEDRLVDAQAKHATVLAEMRAGRLDEHVAGARMAAASADVEDLEVLIAAARPTLDEADRARDRAAQATADAERAFARAEQEAAMAELDTRIRHIEEVLCEAIAERFRLGVQHADSPYAATLPRHWRPTEPLRRAVAEGSVQNIPGTRDTRLVAAS
jgi:hypothetical protein